MIIQEPLTLTRLENSIKAEKPKPLRRKPVPDNIIAPILDTKSTQHPPQGKSQTIGKHQTAEWFLRSVSTPGFQTFKTKCIV